VTLHPVTKNRKEKIMKQIKLVVLSFLALAFAAPAGFCTANAKEPPLADKVEDAVLGKPVEDDRPLKEQVADLKATVAALRAAVPVPPVFPVTGGSTDLLIKGAGVKAEDVNWRIRAGLTAAQAVEVALAEKNLAKEAKK
jgi:hypothetical protein